MYIVLRNIKTINLTYDIKRTISNSRIQKGYRIYDRYDHVILTVLMRNYGIQFN
jgi:hypothetical protein